jgi:hypothetical protein
MRIPPKSKTDIGNRNCCELERKLGRDSTANGREQGAKRERAQPTKPSRDRDSLKDAATIRQPRLPAECRAKQHERASHGNC